MESTRYATEDVRQVMSKIYNLMQSSELDNELNFKPASKRSIQSAKLVNPAKLNKPIKSIKESPKAEQWDSLNFLNQTKEKPKAVTSREFENSFLMRQKCHTRKRENELKKETDRIQKIKDSEKQLKPEIDPTSKRMAGNAKPIYDRYETYLESKNKKLSQMTEKYQKKKEEEEMKNVTFTPVTNIKAARHKTPDQFLGYIKDWQDNISKLKEDKLKKDEERFQNEHTFKPSIDKKSEKLTVNRKPIHERSLERKLTESPVVKEPSLRTKFTKNSQNLSKTFQKTVYDRLQTSFGGSISPKLSRDSSPNLNHSKKSTPDTTLCNLSLQLVSSSTRSIKHPLIKPPISSRARPGQPKPVPKLRGKKKEEDSLQDSDSISDISMSGSYTKR